MYDIKYNLEEVCHDGRSMSGNNQWICYPAFFKVGEQGLFLYQLKGISGIHKVITPNVTDIIQLDDTIILKTENETYVFKTISD